MMKGETIVWFDLETGGLRNEHPDIQVAAVAVRDGAEVEVFERKIQFDPADCDPDALKLNSYTADAWAAAVPLDQAVGDLLKFLRRHAWTKYRSKRGNNMTLARLGGHNIGAFDVPRLRLMVGARFLPALWWHPLDTYARAIWWQAETGASLPDLRLVTLAEHFGLSVDGAHDALADARLSAAVAAHMTQGIHT